MRIYPAIDIRGGRCVRLIQGDFNKELNYDTDPVSRAISFCAAGADYLHIIDLDGAHTGSGANEAVIKEIIAKTGVSVQTGGGIRSAADIKRKLALGVTRVILGTVAVTNPELVREQVKLYGSKIAVGIDAVDAICKISGWTETTGLTIFDHALKMREYGVETIIYTDIARDCMGIGPNYAATRALVERCDIDVIASGGVGSLAHLEQVRATGAKGCVVGNALYTGAVKLSDIVSFERSCD